MPPPVAAESKTVPLCVDLDGTVIQTDLLWESLVRLLRRNPFYLLPVLFWFLRGRACLKKELALRVQVDASTLPYQASFLEFLREEKRAGRPIVLVTASDRRMAEGVAAHLGLFTEVLASDGVTNLRGKNKVARLCERFGERGFDYAGNSSVDLPVWARARQALVVNGSPGLAERARKQADVGRVFPAQKSPAQALWQALRPHQWAKNLILFVPLLTAHKITEPRLAIEALWAFLIFCLCASGVYLLNDLFDLDADRSHAGKRLRPFAAGELPLSVGLVLSPLLLGASLGLACLLARGFAVVLAVYLALTTSYSWRLKQVALLDVFCLAALYTIRLIGGHEATGVEYSFWLLIFSMFIFLSLALLKRFVELDGARQQNQIAINGRGYTAQDTELVAALGTGSGYLAVLVLALYVMSPQGTVLYHQESKLLLLICPLFLYWISRVWLLAHRGQMHDDPILFALKDRTSYIIGVLTFAVIWLAARNWTL
jgi:4-hydroxybenzoate polyprenyltransferase/phosphoserine phosphatase